MVGIHFFLRSDNRYRRLPFARCVFSFLCVVLFWSWSFPGLASAQTWTWIDAQTSLDVAGVGKLISRNYTATINPDGTAVLDTLTIEYDNLAFNWPLGPGVPYYNAQSTKTLDIYALDSRPFPRISSAPSASDFSNRWRWYRAGSLPEGVVTGVFGPSSVLEDGDIVKVRIYYDSQNIQGTHQYASREMQLRYNAPDPPPDPDPDPPPDPDPDPDPPPPDPDPVGDCCDCCEEIIANLERIGNGLYRDDPLSAGETPWLELIHGVNEMGLIDNTGDEPVGYLQQIRNGTLRPDGTPYAYDIWLSLTDDTGDEPVPYLEGVRAGLWSDDGSRRYLEEIADSMYLPDGVESPITKDSDGDDIPDYQDPFPDNPNRPRPSGSTLPGGEPVPEDINVPLFDPELDEWQFEEIDSVEDEYISFEYDIELPGGFGTRTVYMDLSPNEDDPHLAALHEYRIWLRGAFSWVFGLVFSLACLRRLNGG